MAERRGWANLWGSNGTQNVTCSYVRRVGFGDGFTYPTVTYTVGGGTATGVGVPANMLDQRDFAIGNYNGGSPSTLCALSPENQTSMQLLDILVDDNSSGLFEIDNMAFGVSSFAVALILLYVGWRHVKKMVQHFEEDDNPDDALEYYTDDQGNERFRVKPLYKWRMDQ